MPASTAGARNGSGATAALCGRAAGAARRIASSRGRRDSRRAAPRKNHADVPADWRTAEAAWHMRAIIGCTQNSAALRETCPRGPSHPTSAPHRGVAAWIPRAAPAPQYVPFVATASPPWIVASRASHERPPALRRWGTARRSPTFMIGSGRDLGTASRQGVAVPVGPVRCSSLFAVGARTRPSAAPPVGHHPGAAQAIDRRHATRPWFPCNPLPARRVIVERRQMMTPTTGSPARLDPDQRP